MIGTALVLQTLGRLGCDVRRGPRPVACRLFSQVRCTIPATRVIASALPTEVPPTAPPRVICSVVFM